MMADDGNGGLVKIPSVYITNRDGNKLKNLLKDYPGKVIILKINFRANKYDPVHYSFHIDTPDDKAYTFIR